MAKLSNINGRFAVEDDGAIQFNGQAGTSGYVLESRGASSPPVWTDRDTGNVTGTGAANRVTYWDSTTNVTSDAGFTYNGFGRVTTDESFNVSKSGADTAADGPFFGLKNVAGTRQYINQLDASNNIDYWYYNGTTWTQTISLLNNGGANFGGSVTVSGISSTLNTGNSGAFITNDTNNYPRISTASANIQLGLFRTTTGPGGVYIGGFSGGFEVRNGSTLAPIFNVDQSGNVGIGQTSPIFYVHSNNVVTIPNSRYLNFNGSGDTEIGQANFKQALVCSFNDSTATSQPKNIGIILHNDSTQDNNFTPMLAFGALSNSSQFSQVVAGIAGKRLGTAASDTNWSAGELWFWTGRTTATGLSAQNPAMVMDSYGNVGIGGSPSVNFEIAKAGARIKMIDGTNQLNMGLWDGANYRFEGDANRPMFFTSYQGNINFGISGGTTMTVQSGGVGIGTTSPETQLSIGDYTDSAETITIATSNNGTGRINFYDNNNTEGGSIRVVGETGGSKMYFANRWNTDSDKVVFDLKNGNVGVGDTAPASLSANTSSLTINSTRTDLSGGLFQKSNGTIKFQQYWSTDGIQCDVITGNYRWRAANTVKMALVTSSGTLTVVGDIVAFGNPSDKRLKENIKPIESALDKVSKLQGVTFDWKKSDSILDIKEDIGFIAQDVQKVLPELVRENKDGMLSMRHQGIAPILLEAIKELKAEIEELKSNKCNCNK